MRATSVLVLGGILAGLAGCGSTIDDRVPRFDGYQFRGKAEGTDKNSLAPFEVVVRDAGKSVEGAREAGRYQGTTYCIHNFGTSEIIWTNGPDAPDGALRISDGNLILTGRCDP